mmetsp:Transcript_31735/g.84026  ORF Transcript_31735/g.84026 Transcript_31735/m.84026 type:complete len:202 (+) Transcript_31735:67-672(+)
MATVNPRNVDAARLDSRDRVMLGDFRAVKGFHITEVHAILGSLERKRAADKISIPEAMTKTLNYCKRFKPLQETVATRTAKDQVLRKVDVKIEVGALELKVPDGQEPGSIMMVVDHRTGRDMQVRIPEDHPRGHPLQVHLPEVVKKMPRCQDFEAVQLLNLMPRSAVEAKRLIPTLENNPHLESLIQEIDAFRESSREIVG